MQYKPINKNDTMKKTLTTWQVLLIALTIIAAIVANEQRRAYQRAKAYIEMMEADNEDYVMDVASETDTYQMYHSQK